MRDKNQVFQLLGETSGSIFPLAREVMGPLFEKYFSEQRFYQPIFIAYQLIPTRLTETLHCKITPYNNPDAIRENLADAARAGYLEEEGAGEYRISEKGNDAIEAVHEKFYGHINEVNQFPAEKLKTLADLLKTLAAEAARAELKSGILSLELARGGHPEVQPGTLAEVDQLLDDMNAFRDDSHIAAWMPTGVSGQVWETLTFLWNGLANSAKELAEKLPYRSYLAEEYQKALDQLEDLGWTEAREGGYQLTEEGKALREKAEEETNTTYFNPWEVLTEGEVDRLGELLSELKETNLRLVA